MAILTEFLVDFLCACYSTKNTNKLNLLDCCKSAGWASMLRESEMTPVTGIHARYFFHSARMLLASGQTNKFDMNCSIAFGGRGGQIAIWAMPKYTRFFLAGGSPKRI